MKQAVRAAKVERRKQLSGRTSHIEGIKRTSLPVSPSRLHGYLDFRLLVGSRDSSSFGQLLIDFFTTIIGTDP